MRRLLWLLFLVASIAYAFDVPGVYVEEPVDYYKPTFYSNEIAFVGFFAKGPYDRPVKVDSFEQFEDNFGVLESENESAYAVYSFFVNGGKNLYVVRAREALFDQEVTAVLDQISFLSLLAIPQMRADDSMALLEQVAGYCDKRDIFFIWDLPRKLDQVSSVVEYVESADQHNVATYFPYPLITDPLTKELIDIAPSGAMAALYQQVEFKRGIWKAPAGTSLVIKGVLALSLDLDAAARDKLNRVHVNSLRQISVGKIVPWGARTLSGNSEYTYIGVVRLTNMFKRDIRNNLWWVLFEQNDQLTWAKVRLVVEQLLTPIWRDGALMGAKPEEAFFVICDRRIMTNQDLTQGILRVQVGVAPVRPAEFMILNFSFRLQVL